MRVNKPYLEMRSTWKEGMSPHTDKNQPIMQTTKSTLSTWDWSDLWAFFDAF
jgi:hypothetical protein